ncbi:EAL domain-containing protein [Rhodoferax sp.]|uniref:EAL domain-containing protein n=1 Tax=Rhodoferax sp. TaxID=50421 RepID=UPI0026302C61|nr:EAL domain-containing protein [Rhodoferax sp.]MDD2919144.1 EAL domain-containing protein [Rhodoferax sp.]
MILSLINNIAFLVALVAAGQIVISRLYRNPLSRHVLLGLLFGGAALLGMANPLNFSPGVLFDGRTIVLSVVGVVGGGVAALIAAVMAALYRYQLGGGGATVGVMVALLSALLGVLARQWWLRRGISPQPIHYLALGVLVQLVQLTLFTQIPDRAGYAFIEQAWWVILLLYPLATMLLCLIFRNHEQQLIDQQALSSAQHAVTAAEAASRERFHAYFDHSIVGLAITSPEKGWVEVNDALCATLGYKRDELTRMTWTQLTYLEDLAPDLAQFNRMLSGEINSYTLDKRFIHKDGHLVDTRLAVSIVREPDGSVDYVVAMVDDISERTKSQLASEAVRNQLQATLDALPDLLFEADFQGRIVTYHSHRSDLLAAPPEVFIGRRFSDLLPPDAAGACQHAIDEAAQNGFSNGVTYRLALPNGEHWFELSVAPLHADAKPDQHFIMICRDITERKAHERQLERIAHFDVLTHLPNRVLLADRMQQAMLQAQRRKKQLAVAYLDLDGFKAINDHHGHETGDQVLIALANRMKEVLRESDTIARIGGDEFVAVLTDLDNSSASVPLLDRLLAAAALPVPVGELSLQISASLGVTFYPQAHDIEADQLLRQADQVMYQAKVAGKNRYCVFDAAQDSSLRDHHESLERMRLAMEHGEFVLHYQPKVNMRSGKVIGAEALIRWQHPEKGLLMPAAFLPVIEDHPLAVDLGEWVLDTAMHQMEVWCASGLDLPVSVNIGARQLQQSDFVARLQAILAKHPQVHPGCIELEVLETSALNDMVQVSQVIDDCARIGVKFALDDFGTGYSSLTYLKRLRVALLKIDQSFVRDLLNDPDDLAILQGIIGLAAAFKCEVIAEGVETVAHGTALLQLGCELAQGYGIARPMPPDQLPAWAATWQPDAAWRATTNAAVVLRPTDE